MYIHINDFKCLNSTTFPLNNNANFSELNTIPSMVLTVVGI